MEIIVKKNWNYILSKKEGNLILSVICGTVAQFELDIVLNSDEIEKYHTLGEVFLNQLADEIRSSPSEWKKRNLN